MPEPPKVIIDHQGENWEEDSSTGGDNQSVEDAIKPTENNQENDLKNKTITSFITASELNNIIMLLIIIVIFLTITGVILYILL